MALRTTPGAGFFQPSLLVEARFLFSRSAAPKRIESRRRPVSKIGPRPYLVSSQGPMAAPAAPPQEIHADIERIEPSPCFRRRGGEKRLLDAYGDSV